MLSVCNHKIIFDPLLTQNGIGTGSSGRKQRKIYPPNSVKQRKTEPKWLRFFFGTTYGPEGRGFESLTACHNVETKKMSPAKSPNISGFFATQTAIFLCTKTQM